MADPQQLNLYAYVRNNPLAYTDSTGMKIDPNRLDKENRKRWDAIVALANKRDDLGDWLNPELHNVIQRLEDDKRTFFIEDADFGERSGKIGEFNITKFEGKNDFSEAVIQLDFGKLKGLDSTTASDFVPGFNKFQGLIGLDQVLRDAELAGHEGSHGVWALNNVAEAVTLQKLKNERDTLLSAYKRPKGAKVPFPPDLQQKVDEVKRRLDMTERFAQETEVRINRELNPELRGVKCKK
jgi:hypothetical protein